MTKEPGDDDGNGGATDLLAGPERLIFALPGEEDSEGDEEEGGRVLAAWPVKGISKTQR